MSEKEFRSASRLLFGLTVIALGVLFTLSNMGLVRAREVLGWWPALLVAYGLTRVFGVGGRASVGKGLLFTLIGTWLLLNHLGVVRHCIWDLWPLLLILLGVSIIRRGRGPVIFIGTRRHRGARGADGASGLAGQADPAGPAGSAGPAPAGDPLSAGGGAGTPSGGPAPDSETRVKVEALLSSVAHRCASQQFQGGEVIALLGGADIDLRSARMQGESASLEVDLVMGGVNLLVPEDWVVEFRGTPIMGGVDDQSKRPAGPPVGRLVITGTLLMGSLVIKN